MPYAEYHRKEKERGRTIKRRKYFRQKYRAENGLSLIGKIKRDPHTEETIEKMRLRKIGKRNPMWGKKGKENPNWKGGVTLISFKVRNSFKYRLWRSDVFTRDNFTCQNCGRRGGKLEAHHVESLALILELNDVKSFRQAMECEELWNVNNGVTLCKECHNLTKSEVK